MLCLPASLASHPLGLLRPASLEAALKGMHIEDQCPWTEIDTQAHYERALKDVLPLMKELEKK